MNNTKIRIIVDAHVFDNYFQGTSTYLIGLYNSLVRYDDVEITLCALDIENLKRFFPDDRFRFIKLTSSSKIVRILFEYPSLIRRKRFDYCHFQYIVPPLIVNCKVINTIHDLLFIDYPEYFSVIYRLIKGTLFRHSAWRSDLILTVSEFSKCAIMKHYKVSERKITVTPNAVDLLAVPELTRSELLHKYKIEKYILFVSRFEPRKNHIGLIDAYLKLKLFHFGYSLVFVGSKKDVIERDAYRSLVESIPELQKKYVLFLENISYGELNSLYRNADCFVYPSFAEGFGIPPLEAAVNKTKVLCSDRTAMSDFRFFKYQFNPYDGDDLRNKLMMILRDNKYPYDLIKRLISEKYNWDTVAIVYHKALVDVLS